MYPTKMLTGVATLRTGHLLGAALILPLACLAPVSLKTLAPPQPAAWTADCDPGVAWVRELAFTAKYRKEHPSDPAQARDECLAEIGARGFLVFYKPKEERVSTTLPYAVFLGKGFDSWDVTRQARVVCHELVHAKWEGDVGLHALKRYAVPSGRLAAEANAYNEGLRVSRAIGVPEAEVERRARALAAGFGTGLYRLSGDAARCAETFMLDVFDYPR